MPANPLTDFRIQKYYQKELKFNGVYSSNDLFKIMDGTNVINADEFKSTATDWVASYINDNKVIYLDGFGFEHIPKEIKQIHRKQNYFIW